MKSRRSFESLLGAILLITTPVLCGAATPERIVLVLGQNDPVVSARVLRDLAGCTERVPTAVMSAFDGLRIQQDFASPPSGDFTLAAHLVAERIEKARSLPASLRLLADALGPLASRTTIVRSIPASESSGAEQPRRIRSDRRRIGVPTPSRSRRERWAFSHPPRFPGPFTTPERRCERRGSLSSRSTRADDTTRGQRR